ncbi:MAG: hypothetical protein MUC48_12725 [Leptolyngbya sp. Prado105]|jgi:hypothetical protein|nr:hypothetical protein [Leptolyngbya sp. Prado105]
MQVLDIVVDAIRNSKRLEIEPIFQLFLILFLLGFIPSWVLSRYSRIARSTALIFAIAILINYIGLVILYPTWADYADPAEANVAIVSWLLRRGEPIYPTLDAAGRYINNYGAFSYITHAIFLSLFTPSIFSSKLAGSIAGLSSLALIFLLIKHRLGQRFAIVGSAIVTLCFLNQTSASGLLASSFWVRPDSLLLFFSSLGLFLVVRCHKSFAIFGSAIALGISTNLKVTAFLQFIPIYVLLLERFGLVSVLISAISSLLISALPYLLPQISLTNYWTWLQQVRLKGINSAQIPKNLLWTAFVSIPSAIALLLNFNPRWFSKRFLYCFTLIAGIVINAVISSTRGALENNMLPFVPLLVYLATDLLQIKVTRPKLISVLGISAAIAFVISSCVAVYSTEVKFIDRMLTAPGHRAIADLDRFIAAHPNRTIGIGYGAVSYQLSSYRPQLVFAGNPYLLDSASLMEMQASGLDNTPEKTMNALRTCQTQIWLIPKGNPPFQVYSYYPPLQKLFSDRFRKSFAANYEKQETTEFYDAWFCKPQPSTMRLL